MDEVAYRTHLQRFFAEEASELPATASLLYCCLAAYADAQGATEISHAELMQALHVTRNPLRRALAALAARGLIEIAATAHPRAKQQYRILALQRVQISPSGGANLTLRGCKSHPQGVQISPSEAPPLMCARGDSTSKQKQYPGNPTGPLGSTSVSQQYESLYVGFPEHGGGEEESLSGTTSASPAPALEPSSHTETLTAEVQALRLYVQVNFWLYYRRDPDDHLRAEWLRYFGGLFERGYAPTVEQVDLALRRAAESWTEKRLSGLPRSLNPVVAELDALLNPEREVRDGRDGSYGGNGSTDSYRRPGHQGEPRAAGRGTDRPRFTDEEKAEWDRMFAGWLEDARTDWSPEAVRARNAARRERLESDPAG